MQTVVTLPKITLLFSLLLFVQPAYSATQQEVQVLVRQSPIVKNSPYKRHNKPAPGKLKGYHIHEYEISAGGASWKYETDHEGDEKVVDLNASFSFDPPPAEIKPGSVIELNASGKLSGHSYGHSLSATLSYRTNSNYGVNFKDGSIRLYNGELPLQKKNTAAVISNAKHGGSIQKNIKASLAVSKSARDGFHITVHSSGASISWPYKLMVAEAKTEKAAAKDCLDLRQELKREIDALKTQKTEYDKWQATFNQFYENSQIEMCVVYDDLVWKIDNPLPFMSGIEISKPATLTGGVNYLPKVKLTGATSRRSNTLKLLGELDKLAGLTKVSAAKTAVEKFTAAFSKLTDQKTDYYEGLQQHQAFMQSRQTMLSNYSHVMSRYYCDNILPLQEKILLIKDQEIEQSSCTFNEKQVLVTDITRGSDIRNTQHLETAQRYCTSL